MKNTSIILIIMLVAVLAYYAGTQTLSQSKQHSLDLQEKCAKQAHEIELRDNEWWRKNGGSDPSNYYNHYNEKLNKCFLIQEIINSDGVQKYLPDAFEDKLYGSYTDKTDKSSLLSTITHCYVTLPSGEDKQCKSSEEFDTLIKYYME